MSRTVKQKATTRQDIISTTSARQLADLQTLLYHQSGELLHVSQADHQSEQHHAE